MTCKTIFVVTIAFALCTSEHAFACGGGSGGGSQLAGRSCGSGFKSGGSFNVPMGSFASTQYSSLRKQCAAQAAAHHAKMYPIRLANATKVRNEKLANREARAAVRIAKLEANRQAEQYFLAKSRTWTDNTGQHQLQAILVQANDQAVQLKKADGSLVSVYLEKLSSSDQDWVIAATSPKQEAKAFMLASR